MTVVSLARQEQQELSFFENKITEKSAAKSEMNTLHKDLM